MKLQEWKQFSDLVDKENVKRSIEADKFTKKQREEHIKEVKEFNLEHPDWQQQEMNILFGAILIEKTIPNFWEWKAGKLKINK